MNYNIPSNCRYNHLNRLLKILQDYIELYCVSSLNLCGPRVIQLHVGQLTGQIHAGQLTR